MGRAITIRTDLGTAADLRRIAKRQGGRRTALRLLAMANALEGMSRAQAARAAGIERQSLGDAIKRFNADGIAGLVDRPKGHRRERLSEAEQAILVNRILRGPDPDHGEPCAWTLADLCRFIEARPEREACYQRQEAARLSRQKANEAREAEQQKPYEPMSAEDAQLAKAIRGICRGC